MIKHEGDKWILYTKDGSKKLGTHTSEADAKAQERAVEASKHRAASMRALHLSGSLGAARTEWLGDREYLVVPTVALIGDNVIHAVNAKDAEFVPASILTAEGWDRKPLMLGHPVRNGVQISANDPAVLAASSFGFTAAPKMNGRRLGMESWCDVKKLEALGQSKMLADLRAGTPVEVSTGSFVQTLAKSGSHNGKRYAAEWTSLGPDHLAFLPGGVGACSLEMGCGAHRAAMRVLSDSDELKADEKETPVKKIPKGMAALKTRILALFGDESAAAEEAAELVAYNAMRTAWDAADPQWDAISDIIDELIADETENPTESRAEEDAEETVEDARMDAIRMHCYSMISTLQSICNACTEQQMSDVQPSDPRYMEKFKALGERMRAAIGKEISAKNLKTIQSAHDASHDMHTHTVALGAECTGMKAMASTMNACSMCEGTGQLKTDGKQADCPSCNGTGEMKQLRAACGCKETDMNRTERIAALAAAGVKDLTDKTSDEVLTVLEAKVESDKAHAVALKALEDKQAETDKQLKAAQAAQIPAEELAQLKALAAEKTARELAEKADLVAKLEPLKTLSKEQLEAKTLDELKTLARFAKLPAPADFSVKGLPVQRNAAQAEDYSAPDSYGLKTLQGGDKKKEAVN